MQEFIREKVKLMWIGMWTYNEYMTKLDEVDAPQSRCYLAATLPTMPYQYYEVASNDVDSCEWRGGEIAYNTGDNRFYIQYQTSGTTPVWKRYGDIAVVVT